MGFPEISTLYFTFFFVQDLPKHIIKKYYTCNLKHRLIIIYDFKVNNQIRTSRNLNQGVLQGSVFWCPKGLHIDADFFPLMGFLFLLWLLFTQKGLSNVFEILLGVITIFPPTS
jgi:hypothetical protein